MFEVAESDVGKSAAGRIEAGFRRFWARLGTALEPILGSPASASAQVARIIPVVEKVIDETIRRRNGVNIAPDIIEVRLAYETFARFDDKQRAFLVRELTSNLTEYIHNRRYSLDRSLQVRLRSDPFIKTPKAIASFSPDADDRAFKSPKGASSASNTTRRRIILKFISPGQTTELRAELLTEAGAAGLGRSRDNALILNDASVSNFHAVFSLGTEGAVLIADLGSSNGTVVNGVPVEPGRRKPVSNGDRIRCGDIEFTIHFDVEQDAENRG